MFYSLNTFKLEVSSSKHGLLQSKGLQAHYYHQGSNNVRAEARLQSGGLSPSSFATHYQHNMGRLLLFVTPSARRRIRNFVVDLGRRRGWVDEIVTPVLCDMILAGNLASLSINLQYDAGHGRQQHVYGTQIPAKSGLDAGNDPSIFTKPPLAGLLKVLADPDLESAQLVVSKGHPPVWCKYHRTGSHSDSGSLRLPCPDNTAVDWLAIVREVFDPEGAGVGAPRTDGGLRSGRV
ncbi:hypothetical protein NQ176_g4972 [Zarea fungicola]|uniref:Uncharacterized protein n=1 Tax=Zarea fungicola TaxID=93591 RepID=A0ACC1NAS0_9HYPO|nr:hypothetical protein NQ176_g4972 [Lecanicillium fungicola]